MHERIEQQGVFRPDLGRGPCVEGFARMRAWAHRGFMAALFRPDSRTMTSWEYPDAAGAQAVEWETGVVPRLGRERQVTFVWTALLGRSRHPVGHQLFINGRPAVRLDIPLGRRREWKGAGVCRARFDALACTSTGEWHGLMYLAVPAAWVAAGRRAVIRAQGLRAYEPNRAFFAVVEHADALRRAHALNRAGVAVAAAGKAQADIVLASSADAVERFAARELREYVRRLTGARLPIRRGAPRPGRPALVVGGRASVRAALGPGAPACRADARRDAIRVATWNGHLVLTGSNPRSVLFAVYQWLTAKGCRWIEPGAQGETVPFTPLLRAEAADWAHAPGYQVRTARPTEDIYVYTAKDVRDQIAWMARNGMNWFQFLIPPYERLRRVMVGEMRQRGLTINVGIHNFRAWLPRTLFERHPDYFALVNGARIPGGSIRCASSAAGLRAWERNAAAWARAHPEVDEVSISCDDGITYCQCPGCLRLKPMDQLQIFYNRAARAIRRADPGKRICFLSYTGHYEPSAVVPACRDHTSVMVDLFARCPVHALGSARCGRDNRQAAYSTNTPEVRAPETNRYLCRILKRWRRTLDEVLVFDNVMIHARMDTPFPYPHVLGEDLRYLHDVGVSGFAGQADLTRWSQGALNLFVIARMTWDPNRRLSAVLDEYYRTRFGPAGAAVRAYDRLLERLLEDAHTHTLLECLTPEAAAECRRLLGAARRAARSAPYHVAVRRVAVLHEYTERLWTLARQRQAILADVAAGRLAAARRRRRAAVAAGRAFARFAAPYRHENVFIINAASKAVSAAMNDYPFVRRRARLPRWVRLSSFGAAEHIRHTIRDRARCQRLHQLGSALK